MPNRRRGFTLAEVIVCLGFLAFMIATMSGLLYSCFAAQEGSEEDVAAANLARTVLDQWKSRPYDEIAALVGNPPPAEARSVDGRDYECNLRAEVLTPPAENPDAKVLVLTVVLNWKEQTTISGNGGRSERDAQLEVATVVSPLGAL